MAISVVRSTSQTLRHSVRGVDFDLDKMRSQLNSGANELPEYKTTEELHQWMKAKRLERRQARMKSGI
ncbi:hypothetical protein [Acinetobacter guillouiae]|uniref:hypothetical protein n=1 Tax=Acinetobacter guillouiae TaxID=106649 RepID=UPI003AF7C2D4